MTNDIKNTFTYSCVLEEAKELSIKLNCTIYISHSKSSVCSGLHTSIKKEGNVIAICKNGEEITL
jgi:hypothetical protein